MNPRLSRVWIGPAAVLITLCSFSHAIAAPGAADGAAAAAQVPPLCTDKAVLKRVTKEYNGVEEMGENIKLKDLTDVKETRLGVPPAGVNQYATKTTYGVSSRSCQAIGALSNGKTDPLYWRMDYLVEATGHSINYDQCSLRHSMLDTQCRRHRDGQ